MRVVVVGASGYVGSRLVPELLRRGHEVVATYNRALPTRFPWGDGVSWRQLDVLDEANAVETLQGADAVCYLVHGLGDADFMQRDRQAADTMRHAVGAAGVARLVYLSGIVPDLPVDELSDHLLSRLEVEEILSAADASVLTLRASMVVGAGSTSFEVMRQLSSRLPFVTTVPAWMAGTVIQPVAVSDTVHYLAEALERVDIVGHLDAVGPDQVTYAALLRAYAAASGLLRVQVPVWLLPVDAVARVAGLLVDVPSSLVESLIPSLGHDMVADRDAAVALGSPEGGATTLDEAIRRSLATLDPDLDGAAVGADPMAPSAGDPPWSRHRSAFDIVRRAAGLGGA